MTRVQVRELICNHPEILSRLSDSETAEMLRLHYIDGMEWDKVAAKFFYSVENVYIIRRKAVEELIKIIEESEV